MKVIKSSLFLLALGLWLSLSALGCATLTEERPGDPRLLEESARALHMNMRWSRWEHASDLVHEAYRQEFLGRYEELGDDFRIVEMDLKSAEIVEEGFAAVLEVEQQWYQLPNTTMEKERFVERWVWEDGAWTLRERLLRTEWREQGRTFASEESDRKRRDREKAEARAEEDE